MILIAESGSTRTDWVFIEKNEHVSRYQTAGFNPYYIPGEDMVNTMEKELLPMIDPERVRYIFYYGSGCSTEKKRFIVEEALGRVFPNASIEVHHDLLGAARGLFGKESGIACIMGTGSNSCLYDGNAITENIPSLGYFFGDEGSGAYIGKLFLSAYLKNELPLHINEAFREKYNFNLEDILDAVYNKPRPSRFLGSFAEFVSGLREDPIIHEILYRSFDDFIQERIMRYNDYDLYDIRCTGSVVYHLQDLFLEAAEQYGIRINLIVKDPVDGLIEYHKPDLFRFVGFSE